MCRSVVLFFLYSNLPTSITLKGVSHSMAMGCGYVAGQNAVDGI